MKTPKIKDKSISKHSRAARRAEDTSAGVRSVPSPEPQDRDEKAAFRPDLAGRGVSKKTSKKQMTRQQRLRHQKGLDRADMNNGKLEKKVKDSLSRAKTIKARAAAWDDLNGSHETKGTSKKSASMFSALQQDDDGHDDEDVTETDIDLSTATATAAAESAAQSASDDEVL